MPLLKLATVYYGAIHATLLYRPLSLMKLIHVISVVSTLQPTSADHVIHANIEIDGSVETTIVETGEVETTDVETSGWKLNSPSRCIREKTRQLRDDRFPVFVPLSGLMLIKYLYTTATELCYNAYTIHIIQNILINFFTVFE